jgi:hypothetical protein
MACRIDEHAMLFDRQSSDTLISEFMIIHELARPYDA